MFYVQRGQIPHKRHTQFRKPDGSLYAEELFGVEGFSGRESLLYHHTPPTQTHQIEKLRAVEIEQSTDEAEGPHRHRLVNTGQLVPRGTAISGRIPLFYNADVTFGVVRPAEPMEHFYRNGEADEMFFVHTGHGTLETVFGPIDYGPGDYLVIPIGTTYRLQPGDDEQRMLWLECPSNIEPPRRYRNEYGQLLEFSPYMERDIRPPGEMAPHLEEGDFVVEVKTRGRVTAYHYRHHPFDVVGWDGYLWPFAFNIGDFEPITGRIHQPPPVHLTFQPRNFVICSFVPRKFDYHPLSIPAPYNHSNINSDEVIYYVAGNFMSRRGVDIASFTVHPAGIPHGPHPGTVEASIGKEATEELAVMIDTFHPLHLTRQASELEDERYPYSWLPSEDHAEHTRQLSERGPEAFPD
ncbi:MAG TPA: homogentisate 1,2-dioxygenase [Candidatus Limnocylindria bacterium]|nr:homogentisate 1,2-dioxygenase [Candidatus Limnocylindria bacterium]